MPSDVRTGEGPDVEALHRALYREPTEPTEGREPAPAWLWALAAISLFLAGYYLGRHAGELDAETFPWRGERRPPEVLAAELAPVDGATVYASRCAACHQADARGVPGAFPPLVGSEWVTGSPETMARIVLRGITGPITVAGAQFAGTMPGWAGQLSDAEIAAVIAHERQLNGAPTEEVTADLVGRIRAETESHPGPYTAQELTP